MAGPSARGFTYLGLIMLLMIIGLTGAAALKTGTLLQRAAAEEELLEIGAQFSEALRSYAAATPPGQLKQPRSLQDLLKDPRFPNPRRHLRKIFVDPITGKAEWGIVWLGDKVGVLGVYSLSDRRPLKVANFDIRFQNMENRERISDWKFMIAGGDGVPGAVPTPPNAPVGSSLFDPPAAAGAGASAPPAPEQNPARETAEAGDVDMAAQERAAAEAAEAERLQAEEAERAAEAAAAAAASAASAAGIDPNVPPPGRKGER